MSIRRRRSKNLWESIRKFKRILLGWIALAPIFFSEFRLAVIPTHDFLLASDLHVLYSLHGGSKTSLQPFYSVSSGWFRQFACGFSPRDVLPFRRRHLGGPEEAMCRCISLQNVLPLKISHLPLIHAPSLLSNSSHLIGISKA